MLNYEEFLLCQTPDSWLQVAIKHQDVLLIDHANCEKKAAATAVNLLFRYQDYSELLDKMSRLAREELRHFEQVMALMRKRGIVYKPLSASRYAGRLRQVVRTSEPYRMIDTLIVGAFIEARSCERFSRIAPFLDEELAKFYRSLLKSEARHFLDYLHLAERATSDPLESRIAEIAEAERNAILDTDNEFRFHSGQPGPDEVVTF